MSRDTIANKTKDAGKWRARDACWSSEWSFIEEVGAVLQKTDQSAVAKKQGAANLGSGRKLSVDSVQ